MGDWRKLHKEELHNLYSSPSIIRMIKSMRMRWAGHVARTGRRGMHIGCWWVSQKERDHQEDQDVHGCIVLKWILEREDGVVWTGLICLRRGTSGVEGSCDHGNEHSGSIKCWEVLEQLHNWRLLKKGSAP
jgi:hypothetical protein